MGKKDRKSSLRRQKEEEEKNKNQQGKAPSTQDKGKGITSHLNPSTQKKEKGPANKIKDVLSKFRAGRTSDLRGLDDLAQACQLAAKANDEEEKLKEGTDTGLASALLTIQDLDENPENDDIRALSEDDEEDYYRINDVQINTLEENPEAPEMQGFPFTAHNISNTIEFNPSQSKSGTTDGYGLVEELLMVMERHGAIQSYSKEDGRFLISAVRGSSIASSESSRSDVVERIKRKGSLPGDHVDFPPPPPPESTFNPQRPISMPPATGAIVKNLPPPPPKRTTPIISKITPSQSHLCNMIARMTVSPHSTPPIISKKKKSEPALTKRPTPHKTFIFEKKKGGHVVFKTEDLCENCPIATRINGREWYLHVKRSHPDIPIKDFLFPSY